MVMDPELPECTESLPLYVGLTVWLPGVVGVNVTLHLLLLLLMVTNVHGVPLTVPPVAVQETVPPGALVGAVSLSETVAVQVMAVLRW
jgi:hypothetical protein